MKILIMSWMVYDSRVKEFCDNYTGEGILVRNLAEELGKYVNLYLFIGKQVLSGFKMGHINFVKTDYKFDLEHKDSLSENEIHLERMTRAFLYTLDKINPDIVNFHSSGDLTLRCIKICKEKNIPYVFTEHLFIELDKTYGKYERLIMWEKSIHKIPEIKIIAVSTGMKKKILLAFPNLSQASIKVIPNGTDFGKTPENIELKNRYFSRNEKILLCVGSLMIRKNQRQIVRVYQMLSNEIKDSLKIIFCGKDTMSGILQSDITEAKLNDNLIYIGTADSNKMKKLYSIADGLVMPSYAEGLSIAALEAISYGLPIIMFNNLECADDLNDEKVVCFANERTDLSLAKAIENWFYKEWDRDYISRFAKFFSLERMTKDYIKYYKELCEKKRNECE